jgi:creatinine amidohydrolase
MNVRTPVFNQICGPGSSTRTIALLIACLTCAVGISEQPRLDPSGPAASSSPAGTATAPAEPEIWLCHGNLEALNLIVNSEAGGNTSDEAFCNDTLAFVDAYRAAGGSPKRWIVQSWYLHPKQVVPESEPHTMTALVRAVIEKLHREPPATEGGEARQGRSRPVIRQASLRGQRDDRIVLEPDQGKMAVRAHVPGLKGAGFTLGIPETIGCREAMLVNFPEAKVEWSGPDQEGAVSCMWGPGGRISYTARLIPAEDYVDVEMTVRNHTEFLWHDVFAFNCLNPVNAPAFEDWKLERTYMSSQGKPLVMSKTQRVKGHMPTVGFYLHERIEPGREPIFVRGFGATSPNRTDGSWIVTLSEPAGSYMAATTLDSIFLFDNLDRCCIHSAPSFGDIGPGEASTTVSRFYLARGKLDDFLNRYEADKATLAPRQKWARPAATKPHGRIEEMLPDELEKVLERAPIAFVPLGTYEHHGWHLPVCFDGIKAHALCERVAARTGGAVLPAFFYGTGGGHVGYKWTLILPEQQIAPLLEATLDHLAGQGFKVVVLLTGHYPTEQVDMVHRLANEAQARHPGVKFIGLTEPEITTAEPGDRAAGDHAAKYETSIALALNPAWVRMDRLTEGRDPAKVVLPDTPTKEGTPYDPNHPLYAIHGQDPRTTASRQLGQRLVEEIVRRLTEQVEAALATGESQ